MGQAKSMLSSSYGKFIYMYLLLALHNTATAIGQSR